MAFHLARINPPGDVVIEASRFPEMANQVDLFPRLEIFSIVDSERDHLFFGSLANAIKRADGQRFDEGFGFFGADDGESVGFAKPGCHFRHKLGAGHAGGCGKLRLFQNQALDFFRNVGRCEKNTIGFGHIQIGFIQRERFHLVGEAMEDVANLDGDLLISIEPRMQKDTVRTQSLRPRRRHGGMHAVFARFITAGRHHAPTIGITAHDHGFSAVFRKIALLHRRKKRIHVDMDDLAHGQRGWDVHHSQVRSRQITVFASLMTPSCTHRTASANGMRNGSTNSSASVCCGASVSPIAAKM